MKIMLAIAAILVATVAVGQESQPPVSVLEDVAPSANALFKPMTEAESAEADAWMKANKVKEPDKQFVIPPEPDGYLSPTD
jgi:hypothetical protein